MVPAHLMSKCLLWPGPNIQLSIPCPGKQSAVDQIRWCCALYTVNTCSVPETSRTQGSGLLFVTVIPRIGCEPTR